jgi:hypothetical protein
VTLSPIGWRPVTGGPANLERIVAFAALGAVFSIGYPKHRVPRDVVPVGDRRGA